MSVHFTFAMLQRRINREFSFENNLIPNSDALWMLGGIVDDTLISKSLISVEKYLNRLQF